MIRRCGLSCEWPSASTKERKPVSAYFVNNLGAQSVMRGCCCRATKADKCTYPIGKDVSLESPCGARWQNLKNFNLPTRLRRQIKLYTSSGSEVSVPIPNLAPRSEASLVYLTPRSPSMTRVNVSLCAAKPKHARRIQASW